MGQEGSAEYPPYLPDLTALGFSLWDYVKDLACSTKPTTL
jgi:hypothetical protein